MSLKRGKIGPRVLLMNNRKSHYTRFRLVRKSVTLDDLEGPLCLRFKTHADIRGGCAGEGRGVVKRQEVIENVDFQGFRTYRRFRLHPVKSEPLCIFAIPFQMLIDLNEYYITVFVRKFAFRRCSLQLHIS